MTPVNVPVYSKDFDPVFFYPLGRKVGNLVCPLARKCASASMPSEGRVTSEKDPFIISVREKNKRNQNENLHALELVLYFLFIPLACSCHLNLME